MLALSSEHELIQWIELAEGHALQACQVSDEQRRAVLTILYAYRACYFQDVTPDDARIFFRLVAEAAMALDDHEPAEQVLADLIGYIHSAFPAVSTSSRSAGVVRLIFVTRTLSKPLARSLLLLPLLSCLPCAPRPAVPPARLVARPLLALWPACVFHPHVHLPNGLVLCLRHLKTFRLVQVLM